MSLPVLLLLSFLTVHCGGCDLDWEVVKNIKTTIESNRIEFRQAFPKDYYVAHHYKSSMLCDGVPCCVFPAAVVLLDSWEVLHTNLWDEHVNYRLILELKRSLEAIILKNAHMERLQEEMEISDFPSSRSSPEELLNLTSELFSRWIKVGCYPSMERCLPPILAPLFLERVVHPPLRARLLTTRAVSLEEEGSWEKMLDTTPPTSNSGPLWSQTLALVWSAWFFGLLWGLLA
ncbi:hypothetical protein NHX12_002085 [Muraenolepis orangiensis]|uniref:Uncharacterized protein n=1 Tax=Muraenolepis orangiensis TaxID=630683 RepID=A0A9Q0E3D7_9TELE|nr:hypothetical protein NHX12_002085 [Muraenolepis orangiensis]